MKLRVTTNRYFNTINQFCFIKEIGVGSFGTVKLALHILTNKCYAVKIVNIGAGVGDNELLLLQRQINLHTGVDHPHIIKLWDTLIEEQIVYMIMQLAEHGTLFAYQNKHHSITEAEAFKFFSQTLSAIRYLHFHDIMHRDIKPQNILLDNALNVKICDLGWATDNIHMKRRTFCGTYQYMAPEMVFQKQYNYSIDIWALGVLLYQLLHGYAPFPAKNVEEMREKIKLGYYQLGSGFSKELKSLVIQILQFDYEQRPSINKVMAHPWMEKMRRQIKGQIGKIQSQLQGQLSTRAKVQKEKGSLMGSNKKHKRFDSLANEQFFKKTMNNEVSPINDFTNVIQRMFGDQKKKNKKKCKTQGQECIQKLFTQSSKNLGQNSRPKFKKQKQNNSQVKLTSELSKTTLTFKNDGTMNGLKMKRLADKLNELTSKCPSDKKKTRLKTQKEQLG